MENEQDLKHQIELATRAAAYIKDETTVQRLLRLAQDLKRKLFAVPRRPQIRARAYELWEQSGCPSGRDWDFWLQAERESPTSSAEMTALTSLAMVPWLWSQPASSNHGSVLQREHSQRYGLMRRVDWPTLRGKLGSGLEI
ncbi:DUF2934 domain-containing protein [Bradyrhizobium sp. Gha]|uniref:DUF2934 domain-containing protein n=1 Tax=Bradyrhizobium sp. Gha TaxID=1855318 RepID=UPI000B87F930|nr:DUF2934 domain-containing protein [Bradyrhizobium sp. Gha]